MILIIPARLFSSNVTGENWCGARFVASLSRCPTIVFLSHEVQTIAAHGRWQRQRYVERMPSTQKANELRQKVLRYPLYGLPQIVGARQNRTRGTGNGWRQRFVQFVMPGGGRPNHSECVSIECNAAAEHFSQFEIDSVHFATCNGWQISIRWSKVRPARCRAFEQKVLWADLHLTSQSIQGNIGAGISPSGIVGYQHVWVLPTWRHTSISRSAQNRSASDPKSHHAHLSLSNER